MPPAGFPTSTVLRDAVILTATRPFFPKTLLHFHTCGCRKVYDQLSSWKRWLYRRANFNADGVVSLSRLAPDNGQNLEAHREYIVPNGIQDPFPALSLPRVADKRRDGEPLRVLFVSHLCESKGVLVLVEACGELAARGVAFQLSLVGPFENEEFAVRVRSRVAELRIEDRLQFLGVLTGEKKFAAYAESDVLCHPTSFDTFPIVILEAMAAGIPVISTYHSGIPDMVDDGETGFLIEPHDASALADRLARMSDNDEERRQMGVAGRKKFECEFTLARHLERMREVFLDVAGELRRETKTPIAAARAETMAETEALATV